MIRSNSPASSKALARYIGVPWVSGGRDLARGCDCWGIVLAAARDLYGLEFTDYRAYDDANDTERVALLFASARHGWQDIEAGSERDGDVIVLRIAGIARHAGLVVGDGLMLHSLAGTEACIARYRERLWRERVDGFYRWRPR